MYNFSFYRDKQITFPSHDIDPKKKDKKWHKQWAEAAYARYINDRAAIPYSRRAEIELMRLYAIGNQPVEKYMDRLSPLDPKTGQRKGYMNVSWAILSVVPKFRSVVMGMFEKMDYDVFCNAIDEKSVKERNKMKWKAWAEKKLNDQLMPIVEAQEQLGVGHLIPDTLEELQMYYELGAFKLMQEIAMEKNLQWSFYLSNWNDIKRLLFEDMFDIGYAVSQDYTDVDNRVKARYVDPKNFIANYSSRHTFDNLRLGGEVRGMNLADLRRDAGNQLSDDDIRAIGEQYIGWQNNPDTIDFTGFYNNDFEYENFEVTVVDIEFFDYDIQRYEAKKDVRGNVRYYKKPHSYNKKKTDKRTPHQAKFKNVRKVKWIVGTEFVYDYGYQNDVVTKGKNDMRLSYTVYKHSDKSILSSIVPLADNIQMTWLKMQNAIAMSRPSGISIEEGSLSNVTLGGKKKSPLEVLKIYRQTGDLIYKATTHHSEFGSGAKPIDKLVGGIGPELQEYIGIINQNIEMMRQITGISPAMDASTLNPEVPVGTSKLQIGATNHILNTMFVGYEYIKENIARKMAQRWQILAKYRKPSGLHNPFSDLGMDTLKVTADYSFADMAIKIEMMPTEEQKMEIKQAAMASRETKKAGGIGISLGDYMYISRLLDQNQLKLAQIYMQYKEAKEQEMQDQKQMALEQQRNEGAMQLQQQKSESDMAKIQATEAAKGQREIEVETVKSDLRDKERGNKSENDMKVNTQKHTHELDKLLTQSAEKYLENSNPQQ